jgi:hypothetical protein
MDVWRAIIISAALAPLLVECSQPQGPAAEAPKITTAMVDDFICGA